MYLFFVCLFAFICMYLSHKEKKIVKFRMNRKIPSAVGRCNVGPPCTFDAKKNMAAKIDTR